MAQGDNPVVQQLEEQMERIQERLRRPQRSGGGWLKLLGGLGLGAIVGGALAFYLRSREEEPAYAPPPPPPASPRRDDAILLRPAPTPPSAPAAKNDDAPITLKTPVVPATPPAEEPTPAPATESAVAPAAAEAGTEAAQPASSDSAPPADVAAEEPATATEEAAAPELSGGVEALTDEEALEAPVAEFYANAVVPTDGQCPASHPIKGNINRNGLLIFHTPDSNNYERTKAEACFASAADAEAAGFRKSRS